VKCFSKIGPSSHSKQWVESISQGVLFILLNIDPTISSTFHTAVVYEWLINISSKPSWKKWYFVLKIVLTECEKKTKGSRKTKIFFSNSERSEQFLKQNIF
jgi:hypothetical protein